MDATAEVLALAETTAGPFVPIAEALPAMLWLSDDHGGCVYLNKALRDFWGVSVNDLPRFTWNTTLVEEDAEHVFTIVAKALADRAPFVVEARYRRADGAVRRLRTEAHPRFAPNGQFLGMVGVNVEVA